MRDVFVSAEARWFWPAAPPSAFKEWFTADAAHGYRAGGGGTRKDVYLHDTTQGELGIKLRGGKKGVEIKSLVSVLADKLDADPFRGAIELWTKSTSQALDLSTNPTIATSKTRWLRKFGMDTAPHAKSNWTLLRRRSAASSPTRDAMSN